MERALGEDAAMMDGGFIQSTLAWIALVLLLAGLDTIFVATVIGVPAWIVPLSCAVAILGAILFACGWVRWNATRRISTP